MSHEAGQADKPTLKEFLYMQQESVQESAISQAVLADHGLAILSDFWGKKHCSQACRVRVVLVRLVGGSDSRELNFWHA